MQHKCTVSESNWSKFKWYEKVKLVSPTNPLRLGYFSSKVAMEEEQNRHLKVNKYAIHPFSKFRAWYELYLIYLYAAVLITKPIDAGFTQSIDCANLPLYNYYNIVIDLLCWVDIVINFFTGYELRTMRKIELRMRNIAKHYVLGPFFFCDVLSSISKCAIYDLLIPHANWRWRLIIAGIVSIMGMLKIVRIVSFVKYIWRSADYFHITSKGVLFMICTGFGSFMIIHWLACMQFAVPRLVRLNFAPKLMNNSWFFAQSLYNGTLYKSQPLFVRYNHCFVKSSAYVLAIRITFYEMEQKEEYLIALFTYFIGKIMIAFIWIILAVAILNSRTMEIKFSEALNQLQEYMRRKQLPLNLQKRMFRHYKYKYQGKYFQQEFIASLLSEEIRKETNVHACKSIIDNVSIFKDMSAKEIKAVVNYLIPEIFLPNDVIIHAGALGDSMYFLSSGTVAVYTRSGKEVCHLQDGSYFGEIAIVIKDQLRSATVVALETSQVYKLKKKDLDKCFRTNRKVMVKILNNAESRLKEASRIEEDYKQQLLEETLRTIPVSESAQQP